MFVRPLRPISLGRGSVSGATARTNTRIATSPHPLAIPYSHKYHSSRRYTNPRSSSSKCVIGAANAYSRAHFHTTRPTYKLETFKLADIGEGITECEVIKWSVQSGAKVTAFDNLCEVQSDKASVEITSPFDGTVKQLLVKEGDIAKVGEGLCVIEVDAEDGTAAATGGEMAVHAAEQSKQQLDKLPEEQPTPPLPPPPQSTRRKHPLDPTYIPPSPSETSTKSSSKNKDVLAAPSTRHFARSKGVDLALLVGSGRSGRVEMKDVQNWISSGGSGAEASVTESAEKDVDGGRKEPSWAPREDDVVVEMGRTRYAMYKAMAKSLEIPHFGYTTTLDITAMHNLLPVLNAHIPSHFLPSHPESEPQFSAMVNPSALYPSPLDARDKVPEKERYSKLTYLPVLLKTLSKAMLEWPLFRATITPGTGGAGTSGSGSEPPTLTVRPHTDISIALSTRSGLYTPTLQSVDNTSIYTLASRLKRLSSLGRKVPSGLTLTDMPKRGGTITVSNVGAVGKGESAHPVLVPGSGGVAIVALGRARWVWDVEEEFWNDHGDDGEVVGMDVLSGRKKDWKKAKRGERRLKLNVSWSADHRVVEGAEMAAFVESWRGWVENPYRLIGEGV